METEKLLPYLWLTIFSGLGLVALEVHAEGLYWFVLGKGILVLVKLAILLLIPFLWEARVVLLLLVVGIASVGSHMPACYRHYSLLHRWMLEPVEILHQPIGSFKPETATVTSLDDGHPERS
ncbi:MAG: hypothetical protein HY347_09460 [candidate division NC10 bacterium]|nr:hypothetical protein [candidate division NC10 bacterium]